MDKDYKLRAKLNNGKWWTFGSVKKNKYGNLQASFKVTPELKDFINANDGGWVNFSMLADDREQKKEITPETQAELDKLYAHSEAKANAYQSSALDSDVPF